jgi:hypothetical protein
LNGTHELLNVLNAGAVAAVGYKPDQKNPRRGTVILALVDQTALARQQFHKAVYMHYVPFSTPPSQQAYNFLKGLPPSHNGFHVPEHPLHETLQPVFEAEKNMPLLLKL